MKIITAILCVLVHFVWAKVSPCATDKGPLPKSVIIANCDKDEVCDFVRGRSIIGDFEFEAKSDITALYPVVYMTLGNNRNLKAMSDAPEDRIIGCDWLLDGYKCPIAKGKSPVWRLNMPIHKMEDLSSGAVEVQMRSQDNSTHFCAVIWGNVYAF
ncbi:hypothetical protein ACKWTF_010559 [Chironomus riparius]